MVIDINYKRIVIVCIVLSIFLCLATVSAADNQTSDSPMADNGADNLSVVSDDGLESNKVVATSSKCTPQSVLIKGTNFDFQLLDEKGVGIANKKVQVSYNNKILNKTTNAKGHIYLKLSTTGTYEINFDFDEMGYVPLNISKRVTVISNKVSKITAPYYVAYVGVKNTYEVVLTAGGIKLPYKKVTFVIKGKKYTATTNGKGKATLDINLPKGTYKIKCYFSGLKYVNPSSASAKINVKKGMPTDIIRMTDIDYRNQKSDVFTIVYKDCRGKVIPKKTILFKINGKTYTNVTNSKGLASFNIKLPTGVYKLSVSSYDTAAYKKTIKHYDIEVKSDHVRNYGFWLFGADMKKVNLTKMANYGVNQIFLNAHAFDLYGKEGVASFSTQAKSLGINVHIWVQTFYSGGWISPLTKNGTYNYALFDSIINKVKDYASTDGVAGIHFDYLRFPGTAYKYANAVNAINYFMKKACDELHNLSSSLILSAALMPEPSAMKYYYGQDISELSKYLDVIIPMAYKGNYAKTATWIKTVTAEFVKRSNGAEVWTGLQGYVSDNNSNKLEVSTLIKDTNYAGIGGATGVVVFRYSLFNFFNYTELR
ncbi:putative glycoside hydrolase [Methanobrevibacter sp.]|uniref:putative glycoside hydrolase n=1 Tax=Methanobrevibacter sp. TaxID=66852 RepID=UPI0025CD1B75|nr:Ig-like domain repeat protein [Methanobrevibacter sp.]MBQ2832832.1 Ig-like domain repeat protein [Methanobrevibacter sp.]